MRNLIMICFFTLYSASIFAAREQCHACKFVYMNTETRDQNSYVNIYAETTSSVKDPACASYWFSKNDPSYDAFVSTILNAKSTDTKIHIFRDAEDQMTEGIYWHPPACRVTSIYLTK